MKFTETISKEFKLDPKNVQNIIQLIQDGNTIPYLVRFEKDKIGPINEFVIHKILRRHNELVSLNEKQNKISKKLEEQGKLTEELKKIISKVKTKIELNDVYLPYKDNKQSKAILAIDHGLKPLADLLWKQESLDKPIDALAGDYLNPEKEVNTAEQALEGMRAILAERIAEDPIIRKEIRSIFSKTGIFKTKATAKSSTTKNNFKDVSEFSSPVTSIASHQLMNILRGEKQKYLTTHIDVEDETILNGLYQKIIKTEDSIIRFQLEAIISQAYHHQIKPDILTEIKIKMKERAQDSTILMFSTNLYNQLMYPRLGNKRVLATLSRKKDEGCPLMALDESGNCVEQSLFYFDDPRRLNAEKNIKSFCEKHNPEVIALNKESSNKETYLFLKEVLVKNQIKIPITLVFAPESKAYMESDLAKTENPQMKDTARQALYVGRKLQDPLSQLVKIDPIKLNVGPYQHEVDQNQLAQRINKVIQIAVNRVGVNLNTANVSLLKHVSGLSETLAQAVVNYRTVNSFNSLEDLKKIDGITDEIFKQTAGFLYIPSKENPHRDIRKNFQIIDFDPNIREVKDLTANKILKGHITNLASYGVFVDIDIHQDALIHRSQLPPHLADNFTRVLKIGELLNVKVLQVDADKNRVQLGLEIPQPRRRRPPQRRDKKKPQLRKSRGHKDKKKPFKPKSQFGTLADKFGDVFGSSDAPQAVATKTKTN